MLPLVYLARHGETEWSRAGKHTGRTDLPLIEKGEADARALGERLAPLTFALVLTSPLKRAAAWSGDSPPGQPSRNRRQPGRSSRISAVVRPSYSP